MPKYSYSRLNTFDNCALQYKFAYLDKIGKDFENSIEAFMGSKVHRALEELYKKQKLGEILTLGEVLSGYRTEWKRDYTEEIKIVKRTTNEKNYFNLGIKYLTDYYKHYHTFNQDYTVGLEMEINLPLTETISIVGYIDRLSIKDNTYYIHDYKTSNNLPEDKEINDNIQLAIYAIAIKDKYPNVEKVVLVWHYLAFDTEIKLTKQETDYEKIKRELVQKIDYIENLQQEDFKPKESILCEWCAFASNCPVKRHEFKTKQLGIDEFGKDFGVQLANKYFELLDKKEKVSLEQDDLEEKIYDYAKREDLSSISGSLGSLKLAHYDTLSLPTKNTPKYEKLKQILKENSLEQLLIIDGYFLGKYLNSDMLEKKTGDQINALVEKREIRKIYPRKSNY